METVQYSRILGRVKNLVGLAATETVDQRNLIRDLVSGRLAYIWDQAQWPMVTEWEERTVTVDATNGNYVPFRESGKNTIEAVFAVRDGIPFLETTSKSLEWGLGSRGIRVPADYTSVYVYYRRERPVLTGDAYSATTTYAIGDQVYDSTQGDFYNCIAASTGNAVTDTNYWEKVEIPREFEHYLVQGAYADYLRNDGQEHKSIALSEGTATKALKHALYTLKAAQGQQIRPRVRSY